MRVLVVVPRFVSKPGDFYQLPLGLGYIAAVLKQAGHDVRGLNLNHHDEDVAALVERTVREFDADVVATGALSPFLPAVQAIFDSARAAKPSVVNIAGGGVVSSDPEIAPEMMDVDVGIVGEGEATVVDLVDAIASGRPFEEVNGVVFKNRDGKVVQTAPRDSIMDLGTLPWPDYELLEIDRQLDTQRPLDEYFHMAQPDNRPRAVDMITSRSCPYSCTFCFHPVGKVYRERPLDDVFAELEFLVEKYDVNMVAFIDELFSLRKARLLEFCERIKPMNLLWMVQLHVNSADENVLATMREAGCIYISYGIETMSREVLVSMMKKAKKERIEETLGLTHDARIGIQGNLIFGDSAETLETANETMTWWAKNRRYQIYLNRLGVYPGSPDFIEAVRDGLITDRLDYSLRLPINLNISKINDINLDMMSRIIWAHHKSLLNVATVTRFEPSPNRVMNRGAGPEGALAHDIDWDCPRCNHHNTYRECIVGENYFDYIRMSCRGCMSRFDIPNKAYGGQANLLPIDEIEREFSKVLALEEDGKVADAVALGREANAKARGYVEGYVILARLYRRLGDLKEWINWSARAVVNDPFNPTRHLAFAEALQAAGSIGGARLHLDQALMLDPGNETAQERLCVIDGPAFSEQDRETFFVSFSDDPPPYRPTREKRAFQRKKEPAFPVYKRTENRVSVKQPAE
jgi:anaerobic magnesium-protoporphyrin IX monomethyl ester cyclase